MNRYLKTIHDYANGGYTMHYRIQLDTVTQQFIAIDPEDHNRRGVGPTIEQAVAQLLR